MHDCEPMLQGEGLAKGDALGVPFVLSVDERSYHLAAVVVVKWVDADAYFSKECFTELATICKDAPENPSSLILVLAPSEKA